MGRSEVQDNIPIFHPFSVVSGDSGGAALRWIMLIPAHASRWGHQQLELQEGLLGNNFLLFAYFFSMGRYVENFFRCMGIELHLSVVYVVPASR